MEPDQPPASQPPPNPPNPPISPSGQNAPPEPHYEPYVPKKDNVWLIVGIVVGAVLLVLAILAVIMVPAITSTLKEAEITKMRSAGKNIYTIIMADALGDKTIGFPGEGQYANSTGYLKALSPVMRATPEFVSGPHTGVAMTWDTFKAEHNGWSIVEGQAVMSQAGTPFMFSSNILVNDLSELTGPISKTIRPSEGMGNKVVVIRHGGMGQSFSGDQTWEQVMGPATYSGRILHP